MTAEEMVLFVADHAAVGREERRPGSGAIRPSVTWGQATLERSAHA